MRWRLLAASLPLLAACDAAPRTAAPPTTVTDDAGRLVALADPPHRVISLVPSLTDWLVALGAADRLVARTDFDLDASLRDLPSVGGGLTPSIEWLAARRPELVIAWRDQRARSTVQRLAEMGIPVYAAGFDTLAESESTVLRVARLLGLEQEAESLLADARAELEGLDRELAGLSRPQVFWAISLDPPTTVGGDTFVDELIGLAGGRNVFGDVSGWPVVSLEEVVRRRPDAIVVTHRGDAAALAERLRRSPGWRETPAALTGRVHAVEPAVFSRPGPALPWMARHLAGLIHESHGREAAEWLTADSAAAGADR